jgi:small basic protein
MAQEKEEKRRGPRFPPGYFACKRTIAELERFQELLRHHRRWAHQIQFARDLKELIPADTKPEHEHTVIEREMNRLIPLVAQSLELVGITTVVSWTTIEDQWWEGQSKYAPKEHQQNLILNALHLPDKEGRATFFDALLGYLDRGIGAYTELKKRAIRRKYNPVAWIAFVMSLPIRVISRAGLESDDSESTIVSAYAWFIRIVVGIILVFMATKLGISIDWKEILSFLKP